jgi:hypothetical protein
MNRFHALGLGALAGGLLAAGLSQIAVAPSARADDPVTEILNNIEGSISFGGSDFNSAAVDYAAGDVAGGLNYDLTGIDNVLFAPAEDVLLGGTDALTANPVPGAYDINIVDPTPTDLTGAVTDIQNFLADGQLDLTTSLDEFAAGDPALGVIFGIGADNLFFFDIPNAAIIGLTESVLGM